MVKIEKDYSQTRVVVSYGELGWVRDNIRISVTVRETEDNLAVYLNPFELQHLIDTLTIVQSAVKLEP